MRRIRGAVERAREPERRGARAAAGTMDAGAPQDPDEAAPRAGRRLLTDAAPEAAPTALRGRQQRRCLSSRRAARRWLARERDEPRRVPAGGRHGPALLEGSRT